MQQIRTRFVITLAFLRVWYTSYAILISYYWCNRHGSIFAHCRVVGEVLEELRPPATYGNCVARRRGRQILIGSVKRFKNEVIGPEVRR